MTDYQSWEEAYVPCTTIGEGVTMVHMAAPLPAPTRHVGPVLDDDSVADVPWQAIVWNDPVNLMSYVTYVLQKLFGYSLEKATELMLDVHHKGKAVVANGTREVAEMHVFR